MPVSRAYDNEAAEAFYKSTAAFKESAAEQCKMPRLDFERHTAFVHHVISRLHLYLNDSQAPCLDVGCNGGFLTAALQKHYPFVVGIDYSENLIRSARGSYPAIDFRVADARSLPFDSGSFGLVTCFSLINYLTEWRAITLECLRTVRPGGIFAVEFPRALPILQIAAHQTAAILVGRRSFRRGLRFIRERWGKAGDGRSRWLAGIDRPVAQVKELIDSQGFQIVEMHLPRRFCIFEGDFASIIARRPLPGEVIDTMGMVDRSCITA